MSDALTDVPDASDMAATAAAPAAPLSFGAALAAAREAMGVSASEIAGRLRLHPRQIAALEAEQLDALPAATFVRGFIRNYAKELRLDPLPLLASFDARVGPAAQIRAIGQGPSKIVQAAERERISRQLVILGGIGLLIVLGAIGWLASQRPATPPTPAPPMAPAQQGPATPTPAAGAPAAPGTSASAVDAPSDAATVVPPLATAPEAAATPRAEPTDGARPAAVPTPGGPLLRITTGERPSWIEVVQPADGRVVFSGLTDANAERRLLVVPPVRVTVGNASSVKLEYRGKPIDLGPSVRDDVARLTLE
jgi:cytoskeleton protein RodZ